MTPYIKTHWAGLLVVSLAAAMILAVALLVGGCINPPEGTLGIDTDGDGIMDTLVVDADKDGKPDLDPNGNPMPLKDVSKYYKPASIIDRIVPDTLLGLSAWFGIPLLGAVGAAWKGSKWAKMVANLVLAIQAVRNKTNGGKVSLNQIDAILKKIETQPTADAVAKIKDKLGAHLDSS